MEFFMETLSRSPWPMNFSRRNLKCHLVLLFQFSCAFYSIFGRFFWCLFLFFLRIFFPHFELKSASSYCYPLVPIIYYRNRDQMVHLPFPKFWKPQIQKSFLIFLPLSFHRPSLTDLALKVLSPKHTFDLSTSIFMAARW